MPESEDKPPPCEAARPEWACGKFFQCSLLPRGVLWNTPSDTEDEAEEILAGFFYRVPAEEAGEVNLGVLLVCERLTLYLVLNGMPQSFATLIQVCPPFGSSMEVSASGTGGAVMWSDMALQRILRYDCTGTNGDERHLLRYARYVRHLAKPSFAALPAVEEVSGTDSGLGALGEAGGGPEFHGDFSLVVCGGRRIDLSKKFKARAFLRFLHGSLKGAPDKTFYVEEMRDKFNAQFGAGRHRGKWVSERFREDLFKGLGRKDFDLLFETVDGGAGVYRLRF